MSLTRRQLKAMGIEEEKIDEIIAAHTETTDSLKAERDQYKEKADKYDEVVKENNKLKEDANANNYKEKYEKAKADFDALNTKIANEKSHADKEKAVREYFQGKNIKDKNLIIAMRGTNIDEIELADGKIKDTKALDDLVAGDYASLVSTEGVQGANTNNPPAGNGNSGITKESIMQMKDRSERRKAIAEHMDLFTKTNEGE